MSQTHENAWGAPYIDLMSNNEDGTAANPNLTAEEAKRFQEIAEGSMRAQLKHIDKKISDYGTSYYVETVAEEEIPEQVNWWSKFALCLIRHVQGSGKHTYVSAVSLQANSQHLKDILKKTIESYPGVCFATKEVSINKPYHALYHYRHELKATEKDLEEGSEAHQHLLLLLNFINKEFKEVIDETENSLEQEMISYENLWAIFKPGITIYAPVLGQLRAFTLQGGSYDRYGFSLSVQYVDFDGHSMGTRQANRLVPTFFGSEKVSQLSTYPIDLHPEQEEITRQLIARGRRWEQRAGMHFCNYAGIALENAGFGTTRYNIDSCVVVDTKTHHRLTADFSFSVDAFKSDKDKQSSKRRLQEDDEDDIETMDLVPEQKLELESLTYPQCMLANSLIRESSFSEMK